MSSADLRYPPRTLWADYMRAAAGLVLCGLPLLALDVNRWLAVVLGAGLVLFALFLVRTALRQRTRFVLGPDTLCADGPGGKVVEWNRLDRLKLSYFSTKRDRTGGWMQLSVGSAGAGTVKVDSAPAKGKKSCSNAMTANGRGAVSSIQSAKSQPSARNPGNVCSASWGPSCFRR